VHLLYEYVGCFLNEGQRPLIPDGYSVGIPEDLVDREARLEQRDSELLGTIFCVGVRNEQIKLAIYREEVSCYDILCLNEFRSRG